jgi:hypothetical protein
MGGAGLVLRTMVHIKFLGACRDLTVDTQRLNYLYGHLRGLIQSRVLAVARKGILTGPPWRSLEGTTYY